MYKNKGRFWKMHGMIYYLNKKLLYMFVMLNLTVCMLGCAATSETTNEVTESETKQMDNTTEVIKNTAIDQYVGKIWVPQNYDEILLDSFHGIDDSYFTFYISKIDDKNIEGKFRIGEPGFSTAGPPCYIQNWYSGLGNFAGKIDGNKAECLFIDNSCENWNEVGKSIIHNFCANGYLTIEFLDEMRCIVSVKYIESGYRYKELKDFNVEYRPYNISDYDVISDNTKITKAVELDNWGNINVETVLIKGNKPYSMIFFTDHFHDIIYQFPIYPPAFQSAIDYSEIEIIDIDQDGIEDIRITTSDYDVDIPTDVGPIIFYQRRDGLFFEAYLNEEGVF